MNSQPHQPNQLVLPELNYPYAAGFSRYDTAMLRMLVVLVVEIALERMKSDQIE
jgi:hypothetical protein